MSKLTKNLLGDILMVRQQEYLRFVGLVVYCIYLINTSSLFSAGLGLGTNNFAELLALKLLITLALKQGVQSLQVFGDSQLVMNWISGKFRINNILLTQILHEVIRISNLLVKVEYKHIYRERNTKADALANAGANVLEGY